MRFIFKFACAVIVCLPLIGFAQGIQAFPIESRRCNSLSDHAAVQECQKRGQAEGREWEKQMKERYAPTSPRLNNAEIKPPMNCFKRESTGEQVCAN
jgi:hypothetical protein